MLFVCSWQDLATCKFLFSPARRPWSRLLHSHFLLSCSPNNVRLFSLGRARSVNLLSDKRFPFSRHGTNDTARYGRAALPPRRPFAGRGHYRLAAAETAPAAVASGVVALTPVGLAPNRPLVTTPDIAVPPAFDCNAGRVGCAGRTDRYLASCERSCSNSLGFCR